MGKAKTILIIEDEAPMRRVLKDSLEEEQFKVLEAKDGGQGLEVALSSQPDLILLDIIMPKMDGLNVLKKLREDSWGKKVPVIILTNLSDAPAVINALEFNADEQEGLGNRQVVSLKKTRKYIKRYLEMRLEPGVYDFLIKTDCKLEDIIKKVKLKLNSVVN